MLQDDYSSHAWFFLPTDTRVEHVAPKIIKWNAASDVAKMIMSDEPMHFKKDILSQLAKDLRVQRYFTPSNAPWLNAGRERLGKEMLQVFSSVTSEYRVQWTC